MMSKKYLLLLPILAISGCAYTFDKQHQDVEVRTPGAQDAVCSVYANKIRYTFYPPQKRLLPKSNEDLVVDCWAPGNRHREVVIRPSIEDSTYANVLNGAIPGATWDYASNSMFAYPDVVTVDFTGMPLVPSKLPAHNNSDIRQPEDYDLEEFRPGSPRMNADKYNKTVPIRRRVAPGSEGDLYDDGYGYGQQDSGDEAYLEDDSGAYVQDMFVDDEVAIENSISTDDDGVIVLDGNQDAFQEDITIENESSASDTVTSDGEASSSQSVDSDSVEGGAADIDGLGETE